MPVSRNDIEKSVEILRRYGATRIVLFGSAVESLETARDLDLACDGIEGWEFFRAAAELEDSLSVPVDLIPLSPPSPFAEHAERWGCVIYECEKAAR